MNREAMVKQRVLAILRGAGCTVMNLDQGYRPGGKRHGTTRQTKGLADLYVFVPRKGLAFWVELKAPDRWAQLDLPDAERDRLYREKMSPEQALFALRCSQCGVPYVLGGAAEVEAFLAELGLVARHDDSTFQRKEAV